MSGKCGEYDEAMTYLIWVCCAPRKGKLDFIIPRLVIFLFNDLPFDASGPLMGHDPIPSFPIFLTFFSSSSAPTAMLGDLRWRLGRDTRGGGRWLCALSVSLLFCSYLHCCLNLMGSLSLVNTNKDLNRLFT